MEDSYLRDKSDIWLSQALLAIALDKPDFERHSFDPHAISPHRSKTGQILENKGVRIFGSVTTSRFKVASLAGLNVSTRSCVLLMSR